jgi:hypothetical protein
MASRNSTRKGRSVQTKEGPTPIPKKGSIKSPCSGKITQAIIDRIEPWRQRYSIRDTGQPGLILRVGTSGKLSLYLDYRNREGKRCLYRIGNANGTSQVFSPVDARQEAQALLAGIAKGEDPAAAKRQAREESKRQAEESAQADTRKLKTYLEGDYREHVLAHRKSGDATEARIRSAWKDFLDKDMADWT